MADVLSSDDDSSSSSSSRGVRAIPPVVPTPTASSSSSSNSSSSSSSNSSSSSMEGCLSGESVRSLYASLSRHSSLLQQTAADSSSELQKNLHLDKALLEVISPQDTFAVGSSCLHGSVLSAAVEDQSRRLNQQVQTKLLLQLLHRWRDTREQQQQLQQQQQQQQCSREEGGLCFAALGRRLPLSLSSWGCSEAGGSAGAAVAAAMAPAAAAAGAAAAAAETPETRRVVRRRTRREPGSKTLIDDEAGSSDDQREAATLRLTERMLRFLRRRAAAAAAAAGDTAAAAGAMSLWEMVVDPREDSGFTGTCMRLFCLTSLVRDGRVLLSTDADGLLTIQATPEKASITNKTSSSSSNSSSSNSSSSNNSSSSSNSSSSRNSSSSSSKSESSQAVLSPFTFEVWRHLRDALGLRPTDKPPADTDSESDG
ncbi:hypothetical protein Emed_002160 [Eimeria media]